MLSANALDDLSWQVAEIFSKIFLNISRATLLAFVLDKLQTVGAIPSVKHQNLANLSIFAFSSGIGGSIVSDNVGIGDLTVRAASPLSVSPPPRFLGLLSPPSTLLR